MLYFDSEGLYIESLTSKLAKLTAIENIQASLLTTALKAVGTGNMSEYMLNDGQTIIKTVYRDASAIYAAYDNFEKIRQRMINQINGRIVRLVDSKNMRRNVNFR